MGVPKGGLPMSGKRSLTEVLLKLTDALLQRSKASGNVVLSSSTQALDLGGGGSDLRAPSPDLRA